MSDAPICADAVCSSETTLELSEKARSLSGNSSEITDSKGKVVFKIDGHNMTVHARRSLVNAKGKTVGQLRESKGLHRHKTYYIGTKDDDKKMEVKEKGTFDPVHCDAEILNHKGKKVGECKGNWRSKDFTIDYDGKKVCTVHRKTDASGKILNCDNYDLKIKAGVDMAFVVLVVTALDEMYH
uniref:Tubby C-terminal domain-containing protein n=1 Tax=Paramoeba aestuarina TaxID=180227 RepID=A0A7S4NT99_9EUKA|mmetsp:Transcript_25730/g.40132  ORF Transcript_25730/g.40132 Transcript_25730/m.40132 type:complete len:183 (+) Transcript_25730:63-611(+)|eukprot:CAMPEP_0201506980 /NCGR_PEP_ID=MMETSP0161_2-20130828/798_1 /ASSEMBLY_ACC=CAM_ASM_000251 /TAXON_ID=180227 /ORGANISM="Neoparamoeba aestuarina, Strain SoJaBio B1-5/56/2" /LENGTH=182 /DNA_ID=CAMNT_0047901231 /DNA_START=59 /DNA_END=607 /DNA_ORIENTATION=+